MAWPPQPNNRISGRHPDAVGLGQGTSGPDRDGGRDDRHHEATQDADDTLARFAAEARVEERVAERRRQRWLERQTAESSTFGGLLANLAEIGRTVVVRTSAGGTHRGVLCIVGHDCLALTTADPADQRLVVVGLAHVVSISAGARIRLTGERAPAGHGSGAALQPLLVELAEERPHVLVGLTDTTTVVGRLSWVGIDVVALTLDDRDQRDVYVRLSSVVDVSLSTSG